MTCNQKKMFSVPDLSASAVPVRVFLLGSLFMIKVLLLLQCQTIDAFLTSRVHHHHRHHHWHRHVVDIHTRKLFLHDGEVAQEDHISKDVHECTNDRKESSRMSQRTMKKRNMRSDFGTGTSHGSKSRREAFAIAIAMAAATTVSSSAILPLLSTYNMGKYTNANAAATDIQLATTQPQPQSITMPLISTGNEILIYYRVDGSLFRAVLDTGSPFLTIPGSCGSNTRAKTGCYKRQGVPSGLPNTYERFDGFEGEVEWRMGGFSFVNATGSLLGPELLTFGVVDDDIMSGPGGVFFGLIKNTDSWIRPTFLGQTDIKSFTVDLMTPTTTISEDDANNAMVVEDGSGTIMTSRPLSTRTLTLSTVPAINTKIKRYIPLTNDLRKYGDPVQHYCSIATSLSINGNQFLPSDRKPIYIIFDTGVTGMVVTQQLFDERYIDARQKREKSLWKNVELTFQTVDANDDGNSSRSRPWSQSRRSVIKSNNTVANNDNVISIAAAKPLTTPFDPSDAWGKFKGKGHVMVIGLAFLDGKRMTVDIDDGRLLLEG